MAEWYFVRHGETKWNAERRVQGHTDIPLHEPGRNALQFTAKKLALVHFDFIYSSDLVRATETAEIIIAGSKTNPPEVRIDPMLREVSFGDFEGMTWEEMSSSDQGLRLHQDQRNLDYAPPKGESYRDLLNRLSKFADFLQLNHAKDDVLIVGHGAALRALVVKLLGLNDQAYWSLTGLGSGSITRLSCRRTGNVMINWNEVGHFPI
jgi:broad specificity phosphatase PhoE